MVGSGQGKERNSEKELEAYEGFKGQRTKLCKTRMQGEFQQRLEEVITDLEKGKEPRNPGNQESQALQGGGTERLCQVRPVGHQDSVVLAQKQKYRPMEHEREPRDAPTHLWAPHL